MSGTKRPPAQRARTTSQAFEIRFKKDDTVQVINITPDRLPPEERILPAVFSKNDFISGQSVPNTSKSTPLRSTRNPSSAVASNRNPLPLNPSSSVLNHDEIVIPTVARRKTLDDLKISPHVGDRLNRTAHHLPIAMPSRSQAENFDEVVIPAVAKHIMNEPLDLDRDGLVPEQNTTNNETTLASNAGRNLKYSTKSRPILDYDEVPIPIVAKNTSAIQESYPDRLDDQVVPLAQPTPNLRTDGPQSFSRVNNGFGGPSMTKNSVMPDFQDSEGSAPMRNKRSASPITSTDMRRGADDVIAIDLLAVASGSGTEAVSEAPKSTPLNYDDIVIPTVAKRVAMEREKELAWVREGEREIRRAEQRKQRKHDAKKSAAKLAITGSPSSPTSVQSRRNSKRMSIKRLSRAESEVSPTDLPAQEIQNLAPAQVNVDASTTLKQDTPVLAGSKDWLSQKPNHPSSLARTDAPTIFNVQHQQVPSIESFERPHGKLMTPTTNATASLGYGDIEQAMPTRRLEEYDLKQYGQKPISSDDGNHGEMLDEPQSKFCCCIIS
ncbi:hypothetical protein BC938DRAFT_476412 [Jimgerdemannia flammicorona]|uniref:Uncharacterized protein n=1 Tax=Jimgerdemannia flammicorona TaxID=994334 RepID=A0A433PHG3_9FUNG|nr:hypothetical protein BC938DRAFT_476412 [Jimgerdemannia flammicorona]